VTTVSLVLGSGGARGLAHVGVIHELEAQNYQIKSVAGCSIGSLIGGLYAAGKLPIFEAWILDITGSDMVSLLDPTLEKGGLVKGKKIINTLIELVGDVNIEDLPMPFTALAADVRNEKEVWINSGSLFEAIRASISLPLFFTPVPYNGSYLIDGGVLNPVPIAPTFSDNTDVTVAVNLGGVMEHRVEPEAPPAIEESKESPLYLKVKKYVDQLQRAVSSDNATDWDMYEVADQAFDAMQSTIARQKLAAYPPDIAVEIPRNACGTFEFDRASELITLGREKARQAISNWR
jgi:NTE family protein